ncbi:MAG: hypothetical protein AB3N24_17730 [Leisingera sp.]
MCPIFIYESEPGIFGVTSRSPNPDLPKTQEPWEYVKTFYPPDENEEADEGTSPEDLDDDDLDDEELIREFVDSMDNEVFAQVMDFLQQEGYVVVQSEEQAGEVHQFPTQNSTD